MDSILQLASQLEKSHMITQHLRQVQYAALPQPRLYVTAISFTIEAAAWRHYAVIKQRL